jgi:hypothetical protein
MKTVSTLLICCLIILAPASAQQITGKVNNAGNQPLANVSVTLLRDSAFIAGTITGEDGRFNIRASLIAGSSYTIRLSLVGYEILTRAFIFPDTSSFSVLQLQTRQQVLGEVVVASKRPLVTRKADRYVVNVEDSYLANGQNGLEVLQRSPGLWVSPNGEIRIVGGQTVTVMINDIVQRMSSSDLAVFLRSLRSEDISKIEVIPNPPAEFEAASTGGIVHIILKKARQDGLTGTASAAYRIQGQRGSSSAGTSLDYKIRRFYITTNINGGIDRSVYTGYTDVTYPDKTSLYNYTLRDNDNRRYFFRVGMVYDFHPQHSLFLQAIGTGSKMNQFFKSDIVYHLPNDEVTGNTLSEWLRKPKQGSYTLNYGWKTDSVGSSLRVILDHTYSVKTELNEVNSRYSDPLRDQTYRSITPSNTYINSAQADYTQTLNKRSLFKAGIKFVRTTRENTVLTERVMANIWQKDSAASDDYRYTEELLMFYGSYDHTIGKTSIKTGLRGEQTIAEGRSLSTGQSIRRRYFSWFPSFFVSHTLDNEKGSAISFNYARRVRRPGYNDLNPYRLQVHDFTVLTGNPNLVPQYTHSFRAGYVISNKYSTGIYLQTTKNFIAQTANRIDSTIIEFRSKNFPNSTDYGLFFETNVTIGKIWNNRNSFYFYRVSNDIDGIKYRRQSFSAQSIQVITLKKIMDIDWVTQYTSASLQANSKFPHLFYMDIGFTRALFKERGRLRFAITDIFNTFREKNITDFNQTHIDFYQKRPTRTFGLSFNYTFRAGKSFTKKQLDNNNSDEKSRL